jgi:integrase
LKHRLNTFAADFGESRLSDITLDELKEWVMDDGWEPRTRVNYLTKISQLYGYAIRHKWADINLTEHIDRPAVDETTPEIFTVEQSKRLLTHANDLGLLPYIAIGLFAGVRTAEQMRLAGKCIYLEGRTIVIGADAAKKRSQRIIEMSDALVAWLQPCREALENGPIYADSMAFRKNKARLLEAAGIADWPANGLRHSFGSYHLAMFHDAAETSHVMGNSVDMVHRHYKSLVTKADAEKFWSLRPQSIDKPAEDTSLEACLI